MTTNPVDLGQGDRLAGEDKHRLSTKSPVELAVEALEFYRDSWDWLPGDGEQPNAVDVGSPPTFYEAWPSVALRADEGKRAEEALAALQPLPVRQEERERIARIIRRMVAEGNHRPLRERSLEAADEILREEPRADSPFAELGADLDRAYREPLPADAILSASPTPVLMERGGSSQSQPCGAGPSDHAGPQSQHSNGEGA